jgi:glycosyltransferase involved in cell wall biosynthesis
MGPLHPPARPDLRHLHFTQSLEPLQGGGLGVSAVALHGRFLAAELDSTLCATYGAAPQINRDRILEFPRLKPGAAYYAPELKRRARQLVAKADVIHGHGLYVGTNLILGGEARRQGKPLVYHAHGFFEPWILHRSRWKKQLAHWLFENANFRQVKLWRALTTKEAGQIQAQGIKTPVVVIPNGLNVEDYPRPERLDTAIPTPWIPSLAKKNRRLLFLSRLHPKKGLDLLLTAWTGLGNVRKDWELVIAGPDENGHLNILKNLAEKLGLQENLHFTGPVTGQVKTALLHSADVFVLPSYSEGFPMSLLEAMACGVPVVATRACNFPDVTVHQAGWECEATSPSVLGALKTSLLENDSARQQRGEHGRRLVLENYAWPGIVARLVEACDAHCRPSA